MVLKQKTKDFFLSLKNNIVNLRTNRTFLICCFLSVIYLISGYWKWLEIGVHVSALIFMAILPLQNAFCIFMFMHSFTLSNIGYNSCFMITFIGFFLILFAKYLIGIKKGKYAYNKKLVTAIIIFYIFSIAISLFQPFYNSAWLYLTYLPLAYFIFEMREEFNIAQGMNYMFGGILTSCGLALISLTFPDFQYRVITQGRFNAFINNTNYLYMRTIFVLTYYMYRNLNNKLSNFQFMIILFVCSIITFATLSKTGIALLALFFFIFIILFLKKDFKKKIKYVLCFCLILIIILAIGHKFLLLIIDRFAESFKSENFLNSLLTHRDEIWLLYFDAIFDSPLKALFGHGLLTKQVFVANVFGPTETHNFYIWLLYRFGIIGTAFLGYIIYLFIKFLSKEKPQFIAYLPLIYLLLESLCDNTMKYYNISYFVFAIMILFMECKNKTIKNSAKNQLKEKVKE